MGSPRDTLPSWLEAGEQYRPGRDRDGFLARNLLALSGLLAHFRLDAGRQGRLSPSVPVKMALAVGTILLVSLARNQLFVLVVLALVLARACLLPQDALARVAGGSVAAAALTFLLMLPAALIGQPAAATRLATKALTCSALTLTVAVTSPFADLTAALRMAGMPALVVLALDVALRSIVRLGETASEVLVALRLRSVGRNRHKRGALGGVGGVVLLKAARSAQDTHDALVCRGFDGSVPAGRPVRLRQADLAWALGFALLVLAFLHLQKAVLP